MKDVLVAELNGPANDTMAEVNGIERTLDDSSDSDNTCESGSARESKENNAGTLVLCSREVGKVAGSLG